MPERPFVAGAVAYYRSGDLGLGVCSALTMLSCLQRFRMSLLATVRFKLGSEGKAKRMHSAGLKLQG